MEFVSRSAMVTRGECKRLRYLQSHHGGTGLSRKARSLPLIDGIYLHEGLATLLMAGVAAPETIGTGLLVDEIMPDLGARFKAEAEAQGVHGAEDLDFLIAEQLCLLECILRAFDYVRLKAILAEYEPVAVEKEWAWQLASWLAQPLRMDAILERRDDQMLVILDFKSVGYPSESWVRKFEHDDQTVSYTLAVEETFKRPVGGLIYEGLVTGGRKRDMAKASPFFGRKVQNSPYCYGYKLSGGGTGVDIYQTAYTSAKGWRKIAAWQEMAPKDWFEKVLKPEEASKGLLSGLFIVNPPIQPTPAEQHEWRDEQSLQELQFFRGLDDLSASKASGGSEGEFKHLLNRHFPKNRSRCHRFGEDHTCEMYEVCWNETVAEDPVASGLYEARIPHHTGPEQGEEAAA